MIRRGCDSRTAVDGPGTVLIPPILEVFVLWHPDDIAGEQVARDLLEHFHGTTFSGLIGGAVEVYERSAGWDGPGSPPRPLPFVEPLPNGLPPAAITVVVPVLGVHLARAAKTDDRWRSYLQTLKAAAEGRSDAAVFALRTDGEAMRPGGQLTEIFGAEQLLAPEAATDGATLCRDLAHSIAGFADGSAGQALRVFISHTKRNSPTEEPDRVEDLVALVRDVIGSTHLRSFFDAADLQPGTDWEAELDSAAETSCLLLVRTDLFASREWCQREVLAAKRADMPIVAIHALQDGEDRGSFLIDHVPSVACGRTNPVEQRIAIETALNKLIDEALKRSLWNHQRSRLTGYGFDWLPANAPEPTTVAAWIRTLDERPTPEDRLFVLHPDPPLGHAEMEALTDVLDVGGLVDLVKILTPRTFASRGGHLGR